MPPLRAAARVQGRVIWALMLNEMNTRLRGRSFGYAWVVLEPIVVISLLVIAFSTFRHTAPLGMDTAPFFATGVLAFQCFSRNATQGRRIHGRHGVTSYPQVAELDLIIARALLNYLTYVIVLVSILAVIRAFNLGNWPHSWLGLFCDLALATLLGVSLGILVRALTAFVSWVEQFVSVAMRVMFIFSGVFFIPALLPDPYREILLYNPVLHVTEFARSSHFANFTDKYASLSYVIWWIAGLLFVGLIAERAVRQRAAPL